MEDTAHAGLFKLRQIPPGLMNALITLDPARFGRFGNTQYEEAPIFEHLYNLVRQSTFQA